MDAQSNNLTPMDAQSKFKAILKFLLDYKFSTTRSFDEFTGRKQIYFQSKKPIIYSRDFEDVDYRDIQEAMKQFAKQKVDAVYRGKFTESEKQYLKSSISNAYASEIDRLFQVSKGASSMDGKLAYIEDSERNEQFILLNFDFKNTSHHRDVNDCKVFVKNSKGEVRCFDHPYAVSQTETKSSLFELTNELEFHDIVSYSMTDDDLAFLYDPEVKFSARFENLKIPGVVFLDEILVKYLKFLICPENATEEQIDLLYDNVQKDLEEEREFEEIQKQIERKSEQEGIIEKEKEQLKKLDFYRFDYATYLAQASDKLPHIKKIKKISEESEIEVPFLDFFASIPEKYDTKYIIKDIDTKKDLLAKYQKKKKIWGTLGWIFAIAYVPSAAASTESYSEVWAAIPVSILAFAIISFLLRRKYKRKEVYYHEKTVQLIEDFKKQLSE